MSEGDVRCKIGGRVTAKACHVVFLGECARRYGALKTTKVIVGTVVEVTTTRKPQTNRTSTFVTADFDVGGGAVK
jgi:phosphoribosylpyrophosphate synthetase